MTDMGEKDMATWQQIWPNVWTSFLREQDHCQFMLLLIFFWERNKKWFMEQGTNIEWLLRASHWYPEDIYALLRKNEQSGMCHVQGYNQQNSIFNDKEISTPQLGCRPLSYIAKLNDWLCNCREFQALPLPFPHVMVACSSYSLWFLWILSIASKIFLNLMRCSFSLFKMKIIGLLILV